MKRLVSRIVFIASICGISLLTLNGCSSLSGLIDAADEFGCPMGSGVNCTTLSNTHARVTRELDEKEKKALLGEKAGSLSNESHSPSNLGEGKTNSQAPLSTTGDVPSKVTEGEMGNSNAKPQATPFPLESFDARLESPKNFTPLEVEGNSHHAISSKASKGKSSFVSSSAPKRNSRIKEKVLLLWVLPWVDVEGDLHGESELWVRVRDARWGIERLREEAMRRGPTKEAP